MTWRSRRPEPRDEAFLAALGDRLRGIARSVHPRPEFRSSLRTSLVMEASTALVPDPNQPRQPAPTSHALPRRRLVIATALVATSLGMGGMASASASALPGEALYPIKRATERVELTFHRGLADRGAFQLELAERRLHEARELSERGPEFAGLAAQSVREFEETAAAGTADLMEAFREDNTPTSIVVLNRFTSRTEVLLSTLAAQLPAEATVAVEDARESIEAIADQSEQACPTCGGGSGDSAAPPPSPDYPTDPASPEPAPEPEPEPDSEDPTSEPPIEPPLPAPPVSSETDTASEDESDEEDEDDSDESEDDESDDESPTPTPTPTPEPTPTPTPTPTPDPTPTPTPTPTPDPTDPPVPPDPTDPGLPGLIGGLIGGTLDSLL